MVALMMLRNAEIAARGILPFCQDTGTATVVGKKGQQVWTGGDDAEWLSKGIHKTYTGGEPALLAERAAQHVRREEHGSNLPAQIDSTRRSGATPTSSSSSPRAAARPTRPSSTRKPRRCSTRPAEGVLPEKMQSLGTAACPPYHLAFVIGGTSAEACLKTVKLASTKYLDELPTRATNTAAPSATSRARGRAPRSRPRDRHRRPVRRQVLRARRAGRPPAPPRRLLPGRHRRLLLGRPPGQGKDHQGRNLPRKTRKNPGRFIPDRYRDWKFHGRSIDLNQPDGPSSPSLSKYPVTTALSLNGTIVVARDIAHAKLKERLERPERAAGLHQEPPGLLRRPGQDPGRHGLRLIRPDHRRPHGQLRRPVPGPRRLHGHARQGQPQPSRSPTPARSTAASTSARSAAPPPCSPRKHPQVECSSSRNSAWKRSGRSRSKDFPAFILVDDKGNDFFTCPVGA
jgi:fumarate hydratase class I